MTARTHTRAFFMHIIHHQLIIFCLLLSVAQVATNVGLSWGGRQPVLRDSIVLDGSLGDFNTPAKMFYVPRKGSGEWLNGPKWVHRRCRGVRAKDMSLKPGHVIHNVFGPNDPPPWYDLNAPRFPRPRTDEENVKETNRRKKLREKFLEKKQRQDPLATLTPQEEEQFQTSDPSKYPPIPGNSIHCG